MRIRVNNIPYRTTAEDLRGFFGQFGNVESVSIALDRATRKPRGFAFVEMPNEHEAVSAIEKATGTVVDGRRITAIEAPIKEMRDGRFGTRRGY